MIRVKSIGKDERNISEINIINFQKKKINVFQNQKQNILNKD